MPASRTIRDHVIVDGSNIATEGRTLPSLAQLDHAVRAFLDEFPDTRITVVVDATFQHRIDASERAAYEEAVLAGELVAPPAGAIGRGDAFIAAIAQKADATIFSNDSFQELHGEYPWMFDEGRLVGGKPVDGVGWVFVARTPVRGSISRRSQRDARSARSKLTKADKDKAAKAVEAEVAARRAGGGSPPKKGKATKAKKAKTDAALVDEAAAELVDVPRAEDAVAAAASGRSRRRRRGGSKAAGPEAVNEPAPFIAFVTEHPVGSEVEATVDRFSSHGAYVVVDDAQCYVPLRSMADPPPRSAREVLTVGETRTFVVESFDSPRRSIDLAVPGLQETGSPVRDTTTSEEGPEMAPAKKAAAKKAPAKKAAAKKAPAKKAAAKKAPAKKAAAKKAPAKKAAAKKRA